MEPSADDQHEPGLVTSPTDDHGLSNWVALFYDLVFVAAILIFTKGIEDVHPTTGAFWIVGVFVAAWWIWYSTTLLVHRIQVADVVHRMLLLFQMLVIVLMAMEARVSVDDDSALLGFEFALLLVSVSVMYLRAWRTASPAARAAGQLAAVNGVAALCFLLGITVGEPLRLAIFVTGLLVSVVGTAIVWHGTVVFAAGDEAHYIERMAAFTLIVCGEAFIENALAVSGATISTIDLGSLVFEFVLVFALFSSYFEDIPPAGINPRRFRSWSGLHLVMQICIAATAVSATKLVGHALGERVPNDEILRLTVPLVIFYLALSGLDVCSRRRPVAPLAVLHIVTAGAVGVVGVLAWYVPQIHLAEALPLIDVVAAAHLIAASKVRRLTEVLDPAVFAMA